MKQRTLTDLKKENQGAILGVIMMWGLGYLVNFLYKNSWGHMLIITLAIFLAYILTTQSQIKYYKKEASQT